MNKRKGIALTLSVGIHILIIILGSTFFTEAFSEESAESNIITLKLRSNLISSEKDNQGKDVEKSSLISEVSESEGTCQSPKNSIDQISKEISKKYEHKTISSAKSVDNQENPNSSGLTDDSPIESMSDIINKVTENKNEEVRTLDKRAIYNTQEKISDTGAILELKGWIWDTIPNPNDDTDEVGKIVFEIEIDSIGEVVSIKTLQRTVSLKVVSIYRASLENITFSRTSDNQDLHSKSNSKGKVTFYLKYK